MRSWKIGSCWTKPCEVSLLEVIGGASVLTASPTMKGQQTVASPEATLIGLGPPEPPGDDSRDAPAETLRAWTTSAEGPTDASGAADVPFVPLSPLFPPAILPPFLRGPGEASRPRGSAAPPALFIAAALIAAGTVASIRMSFTDRAPTRPASVAAACPPSTISVVGVASALPPNLNVKREGPPELLANEPSEPSTPSKKPRARSHRPGSSAGAVSVPVNVEETPRSSVASDEARIETIAGTVRLEDDARPEERESRDAVQ